MESQLTHVIHHDWPSHSQYHLFSLAKCPAGISESPQGISPTYIAILLGKMMGKSSGKMMSIHLGNIWALLSAICNAWNVPVEFHDVRFHTPYANHGAGILTYKTGWFWARAAVGKYSSTMEHMGTTVFPNSWADSPNPTWLTYLRHGQPVHPWWGTSSACPWSSNRFRLVQLAYNLNHESWEKI